MFFRVSEDLIQYMGSTDIYMQMPPSFNNFWNISAVLNVIIFGHKYDTGHI